MMQWKLLLLVLLLLLLLFVQAIKRSYFYYLLAVVNIASEIVHKFSSRPLPKFIHFGLY
jgi:hypothetical protein